MALIESADQGNMFNFYTHKFGRTFETLKITSA